MPENNNKKCFEKTQYYSMTTTIQFEVAPAIGKVSGILLRPEKAVALLVLAHGAGAGMHHSFMEELAKELANNNIASFRYQFPYMEQGKKRPDFPAVAHATVKAAVQKAVEIAEDLPLLAGGKSFGGRMTSSAAAKEPLAQVKGLVFFGFPLHPPGKPSTERSLHLEKIKVPMLFLQGTRDSLAKIDLIEAVSKKLGDHSSIKVIEGGDHSFKTLKRSGKSQEHVMRELVLNLKNWAGNFI